MNNLTFVILIDTVVIIGIVCIAIFAPGFWKLLAFLPLTALHTSSTKEKKQDE